MSVFVDTSVWYAAADKRDASNHRAKQILRTREQLVMSDHVLIETWLLLCHRLHHRTADRFWESLRSGIATIEAVTLADLEAAWHIGQSWPGQEFSLADRSSFAIMMRLGIENVASFDHHFAVFRYGPNRKRAFTVLA